MAKNIYFKKKLIADKMDREIDKFLVKLNSLKKEYKESINDIKKNCEIIEKIEPNPYVIFNELTKREYEVLDLLAHGFSVTDISEFLCITRATTTSYLAKIYDKAGLQTFYNPHLYNKQIIVILAYLKHIGVLDRNWKIKVGDIND